MKKDKDVLFTFYDFPEEHKKHLKTINPIESTFATAHHRTSRTKGCGSRIATLTMIFKPAEQTKKHWIKFNKNILIKKFVEGVKFVDGIIQDAA